MLENETTSFLGNAGDNDQWSARNDSALKRRIARFKKRYEAKMKLFAALFLSFLALVLVRMRQSQNVLTPIVWSPEVQPSFDNKESRHVHTAPTLLSVVHHKTGSLVSVLNNPLYRQMKAAMYMLKDNGPLQEPIDRRQLRFKSTQDVTSLTVNKNRISVGESLRLSWFGDFSNEDNWIIALYCPAGEPDPRKFRDAATLPQARATSVYHKLQAIKLQGHLHSDFDMDNAWDFLPFPVVREEACEFRLWKRSPSFFQTSLATSPVCFTLEAKSEIIYLRDSVYVPTAIHLALTNDPTTMVVQFTTGFQGTPVVKYQAESTPNFTTVRGISTTYSNTDMCQEPATSTDPGKFISPGILHTVTLSSLLTDKNYTYRVGLSTGQGIVWSAKSHSFRSSPPVGWNGEPFAFLAYGDQGCPLDGWALGGNLTAQMTKHELDYDDNNKPTVRAVHHFGDLSYARGAAHLWDNWLEMIQVFTTRVPLMVGVGNHEYDHTDGGGNGKDPSGMQTPDGFRPVWGNFNTDSGGECGVPVSKRFAMPTTGNGVFWYSYDYANVHTIMLSSEHDLGIGSEQHEWLENNLETVLNRTMTPWLIVEFHRPMYMSKMDWDNVEVGLAMRIEFEELLRKHKVDLVLSGHFHSYLRTCDGLYRSKCNNGGPTHIVVGTAGASLDDGRSEFFNQEWTEKFIVEWGYGRVTIVNNTALHWEFVGADADNAGQVKDEVWIVRDRE